MAQRDPEPQPADSLTIRDNRTGRSYELPIHEGAIHATDLRQVKVSKDDAGVLSYDPAFLNTASCRSAITYIDGDRGILLYRGYPIEELAERRSFLDVAWLLINGELPTTAEAAAFAEAVRKGSELPAGVIRLIESFPREAHPMAVLLSAVAALGAYHPEAKKVDDARIR